MGAAKEIKVKLIKSALANEFVKKTHIDKTAKLTVPVLPFSTIDEIGAGMYRGEKISIIDRRKHTGVKHKINASSFQEEEGGVIPTYTLQKHRGNTENT